MIRKVKPLSDEMEETLSPLDNLRFSPEVSANEKSFAIIWLKRQIWNRRLKLHIIDGLLDINEIENFNGFEDIQDWSKSLNTYNSCL